MKYKPNKYTSYLYFIIPLLLSTTIKISKERDIWFILSYGKYILKNGLPHHDILSMHNNFSLVVQQWLSDIIYYLSYKLLGGVGIYILVFLLNSLILYFLYKLSMVISNKKVFSSVITSSIIDILLMTYFVTPRPQMFTFLIFIILLYILEKYLQKESKIIWLIPVLSLLLVNLHASMWPCLFILMLPYLVEFSYNYLKKKDKKVFKLLQVIFFSIIVGFLNPYGLKAMTYSLTSYGVDTINKIVMEMSPFTLKGVLAPTNCIVLSLFFGLLACMFIKKKYSVHQVLLMFGIFYMVLCNFRNVTLFYICVLPFFSIYLPFSDGKSKFIPKKLYIVVIICLLILIGYNTVDRKYNLVNPNKEIIEYLDKNAKKNIKLYANNDNGSYYEFSGYHPYMDGRVEVFVKANNHKEDIMLEYYNVSFGILDVEKFLDKYKFTHLVVNKNEMLYKYLENNENYQKVVTVDETYLYIRK